MPDACVADFAARIGDEIGVSEWRRVDWPMIDAFAPLTGDAQFIHTDPERSRRDAGLSGTVAYDLRTLSRLATPACEAPA